jgi:alpha-beta hydrolase superfamily lysophospholipase
MTSAFQITCNDGHIMPVYSWQLSSEIRAIVLIIHGLAEHGLRYAPIAEMLTPQRFAVFAYDNRGHGDATNMLGYAGKNFFYKQVEDIDLLIQHFRKNFPGKKIFVLGHSMGSFIAQRFFQLHGNKIDGLILSGTNGKQDPLLSFGIAVAWLQTKLLGRRHRSKLIFTLSFEAFNKPFKPVRTDFDWLSRNKTEVDKYIADPRCGFICTSSFFYDFFKGMRDCFKNENIASISTQIPVYIFGGDKDPVGLMGKGFMHLIKNWKKAGAKDIEYKLYSGGRHEMLNEINRNEVVDDLANWINAHL